MPGGGSVVRIGEGLSSTPPPRSIEMSDFQIHFTIYLLYVAFFQIKAEIHVCGLRKIFFDFYALKAHKLKHAVCRHRPFHFVEYNLGSSRRKVVHLKIFSMRNAFACILLINY